MELPWELIEKIFSYLPILDQQKKNINSSIRNAYQLKRIIRLYADYFDTGEETKNALTGCAVSWVYNDLILFLNDEHEIGNTLEASFLGFVNKISPSEINNVTDLNEFEEKYTSPAHLLREFFCYMTETEIKLFRYWVKTQLYGKAQALIGSRTHPNFD